MILDRNQINDWSSVAHVRDVGGRHFVGPKTPHRQNAQAFL
jgi:hypothetical protein